MCIVKGGESFDHYQPPSSLELGAVVAKCFCIDCVGTVQKGEESPIFERRLLSILMEQHNCPLCDSLWKSSSLNSFVDYHSVIHATNVSIRNFDESI